MIDRINRLHSAYVPKQLEQVHAWFTGNRKLPEQNRNLTHQAVAAFLSAKVPRGLFFEYDPISLEGKRLNQEAIAAGEEEALDLAVYIDMGLFICAEYDWEALPDHLQALYDKTKDSELGEILGDFPNWLKKFQDNRENLRMVTTVLGLREEGLPPDLGAHDPAYYEEEE